MESLSCSKVQNSSDFEVTTNQVNSSFQYDENSALRYFQVDPDPQAFYSGKYVEMWMASFMNYAASASAARIIPLPLFILALSCTAGPSLLPSDPILHSPNDESQDKVVVLSLAFKPSLLLSLPLLPRRNSSALCSITD